jgi:hypothetical protein
MKKFTRIIAWAMLSIMLQAAVLVYLDKVFFKDSSNFEIVENQPLEKNRNVDYNISSTAKDINVSDDAKYISYFENDKLMVLDTKTLQVKEELTDTGRKILYCDWVADANILMIAEKVTQNKWNQKIKILTLNVKNDFESAITELCPYEEGIKVDSIVSSLTTNTHYVGVSRTGFNSKIYRINANYIVKNIGGTLPSLGGLKAVQRHDIIIYEDSLNKIFYSYTNERIKKLNITNPANLVLIGVDDDNKVYMGEMSNGKITKILNGAYDTASTTWNTINLEKPKELKDIYLTTNNQLLVNDNLTGKVTNLSTGKSVQYDGKLLQITDKMICSQNENKIILTSLSDIK